jgi:guanylate kinase
MISQLKEFINERNLFIVSGSSGAGKSTLCDFAVENIPHLKYSISYTTRPKKKDEVDGINYFFVDDTKFDSLLKRNIFLEWAHVYSFRYGTGLDRLCELMSAGNDVITDLDTQGARNVQSKLPEATLIFILPPSVQELKKRLTERNREGIAEIEERFKKALSEIHEINNYE